MSQGRCTKCEKETDLHGIQRVCGDCRKPADEKSLDMAAILNQWLSFAQISYDAPEKLIARTKKIMEGIPK